MSSEPVWIVIESVSPLQLPIITYEHNKNALRYGTSSHQPLWGDLPSFSSGLNPHRGVIPEPANFMKPNNFPNREGLSSIKLVGVFANLESAQAVVSCSPNRKLLGPAAVQ